MELVHVLAVLRAAGFRHDVRCQGERVDNGYGCGAAGNYRMWHPLLTTNGEGSAYAGDEPLLHVNATGAVATCFEETLRVPSIDTVPEAPGRGSLRWTGDELSQLLAAMGRLRP